MDSDPDRPTTWYFNIHVDAFRSRSGLSYSQYLASLEYQRDREAYEDLIFDVLDPLALRGFIRYSTLEEMREALEDWAGPLAVAKPTWSLC